MCGSTTHTLQVKPKVERNTHHIIVKKYLQGYYFLSTFLLILANKPHHHDNDIIYHLPHDTPPTLIVLGSTIYYN